MSDHLVEVVFDPPGVSVRVEAGTSVLSAAHAAGVRILSPCGGKGTCGTCAVRVIEGDPGPEPSVPRAVRLPPSLRLACLMEPRDRVVVRALNIAHAPGHDERP